jgi:cellulase/cellobiase CelA1
LAEPCGIVDLGGNQGLTLEIVLMNQWDAGACHELHVTNETLDDVIWSRDLRFGGMLDNYWNAEGEQLNPTDWRFGGTALAANIVVLSGTSIVFGSCMNCVPD